jgi:hypothetical protein
MDRVPEAPGRHLRQVQAAMARRRRLPARRDWAIASLLTEAMALTGLIAPHLTELRSTCDLGPLRMRNATAKLLVTEVAPPRARLPFDAQFKEARVSPDQGSPNR